MAAQSDPPKIFTEHSCTSDGVVLDDDDDEQKKMIIEPVVIVGAGIVGLTLALALQKHTGLAVPLVEQAPNFSPGAGAGMGMYPNGLRVLRDISPHLLHRVQQEGYPFVWRRWEHHDGTEVVSAQERSLSSTNKKKNNKSGNVCAPDQQEQADDNDNDDDDLQPLGIRRWKLQQILYDAVQKAAIPVHFGKKILRIHKIPSSAAPSSYEYIRLTFTDGTTLATRLLLAADGAKSMIRHSVAGHLSQLTYTGTTCWYGVSSLPRPERGICFPTSHTTQCHGCFYPTGPNEQCFQLHMPTPLSDKKNNEKHDGHDQRTDQYAKSDNRGGGWTALLQDVGQSECLALANRLEQDGWNDKYTAPLRKMEKAIRVPFAVLDPPLENFHFGRIVLVGDAAHPPVPYLGQGAQQGLEDAGTLAMILRHMCTDSTKNSSEGKEERRIRWHHLDAALKLYSQMRVPRTNEIIHEHSLKMGSSQQRRSQDHRYNQVQEEQIKRDVFFHESHSAIFPGTNYNYKEAVTLNLQQMPLLSVPEDGRC